MRMWMLPRKRCAVSTCWANMLNYICFSEAYGAGKTLTGSSREAGGPRRMFRRHEELVLEMERRGYRHASPLDEAECETLARRYGARARG